MNNSLTFNPIIPQAWLIIALVMLLAMMIFLEVRKNEKYKTGRLIAAVCFVIALAGLFLRPATRFETTETILLLTANFDKAKVDSVVASLQDPPIIYRLPDAESYAKAIRLSEQSIFGIAERITHVFGTGIPPALIDEADSLNFIFFPGKVRGITYVHVNENVMANSRNVVSGIVEDTTISKLALVSAGGIEDSTTIKELASNFELAFTPKEAGRNWYTIRQYHKNGKFQDHNLPIVVTPQRKLKILGLFNTPTFELQFLKTFLAKHNQIVLRYQVSKNDFRYDYINHPEVEVRTITPTSLQNFDLLIAGTDDLTALSSQERSFLDQGIANGLGTLLLPDENPLTVPLLKKQLPYFSQSRTDTILLPGKRAKNTVSFWRLAISDTTLLKPATKYNDKILSAYTNRNAGRVGIQLLHDTYKVLLSGDSVLYSFLWTDIIEHTSRRYRPSTEVVMKTSFPYYTDEPLFFDITSSSIPEVYHNESRVGVTQDLFMADLWHAKTWAGEPGWQEIKVTGDTILFSFYVHPKDEWRSLREANMIRLNNALSRTTLPVKTMKTLQPVSPVYFFVLFLLSAGFLWLAPKL